jgi:hypothetical protein
MCPSLIWSTWVDTPLQGDDPIAGLEAELEAKNAHLDALYDMGDLRGAKPRIETLSAEIGDIEIRLVEARKNAKMVAADAAQSRMGQLFHLIAGLSLRSGNELRALRIKVGQELRRLVEVIRLGYDREVSIELKPSGGYRVTITVHHSKITGKSTLRGACVIRDPEVKQTVGALYRRVDREAPPSKRQSYRTGRETRRRPPRT